MEDMGKTSPDKHWYWEYVVKDWIADTGPLKELTRAFWHEALCRMWLNDRCGSITGTYEDLASQCRSHPNNARAAIADLQKCNTAEVTFSGEVVTLVNRRMHREYLDRKSLRERVARHRDKKREQDRKGSCNGGVTDKPYQQPKPHPQPHQNQTAGAEVGATGADGGGGNMAGVFSREAQLSMLERTDSGIDEVVEAKSLLAGAGVDAKIIGQIALLPLAKPHRIRAEVEDIAAQKGVKNPVGLLLHRLGYRKGKRR